MHLINPHQHNAQEQHTLLRAMENDSTIVTEAGAPHSIPASKVIFVWKGFLFCGKRRDGGLDFPGGKAEDDENASECAVRELTEETFLLSTHAEREVRQQTQLARAAFTMDLEKGCRFYVSIFVVQLARPEVVLTQNGAHELAMPAWRTLTNVLADLEISRTPVSAGCAYAVAVRAAIKAAAPDSIPVTKLIYKCKPHAHTRDTEIDTRSVRM